MINKKILALTLSFLVFLPNMEVSANSPEDFIDEQISESCSLEVSWPVAIFIVVISGYACYRLGRYRCLEKNHKTESINLDKEITLVGTTEADPSVSPEGQHRFELLAIDYINKLLNVEISRLKTSNEFRSQLLTNICWIYSSVPINLDTISNNGNKKAGNLALRLRDMEFNIHNIVKNDKKITAGYLIDLLNETKSLLEESAVLIEQEWYS